MHLLAGRDDLRYPFEVRRATIPMPWRQARKAWQPDELRDRSRAGPSVIAIKETRCSSI
jgi:hypothetical protein